MKKAVTIAISAATGAAALIAIRERFRSARERSLAGEVILITGGSRGLGLALAREFGAQGCKIAICARDEAELSKVATELSGKGVTCVSFPCDVTVQSEVDRMIAAVTAHYGRIDILVNNAGVIQVGPVQAFQTVDFEQAMNVIFWGTVYPTLAVLPSFTARHSGTIVNISSIAGEVSVPHLLPYTSAKFAVAGFSQGLAAELRPQGIQVTAIYPGLMRTGSFVQALFKGNQKKEAQWFTLGANLPGLSMAPGRAARMIIQSVKRGESSRTLSLPALSLATLNRVFPGGVSEILSVVTSTLLPAAKAGGEVKAGKQLWKDLHPGIRLLSSLGLRAMRNYNQSF